MVAAAIGQHDMKFVDEVSSGRNYVNFNLAAHKCVLLNTCVCTFRRGAVL